MRAALVLRPKVPRNLYATLALSVALAGYFVVASRFAPWSPKRGAGLAFGVLAALVFVFEMLYPSRRPRARPLGSAQAWLQAHVYLGLVAFIAVVGHAGFAWPQGGMGWWLLGLSAWTTLTGLFGVWLQKWVPAALAEGLQVEALYERIPALVDDLVTEADGLVADASDGLQRFYEQEARDRLGRPAPSWSFLFDVRSGRDRALEPFRRMSSFVPTEEKGKVEDLTSLYTEKLELDAQLTLQWILRRWLVLHVPTSGLLMALLVVHVVGWWLY